MITYSIGILNTLGGLSMLEVIRATEQKHFFELMKIRTDVFIIEQEVCPSLEIDELDLDAQHYLLLKDGRTIGTLRVLQFDGYYKIGRVAFIKAERGKGYGAHLITNIEQYFPKGAIIRLGAQCRAVTFYEKLGYHTYGEIFDDAGIDHVMMEKQL